MVNTGHCSQDCCVIYVEYTIKMLSSLVGKCAASVLFQV
jgi:hypothetical protein